MMNLFKSGIRLVLLAMLVLPTLLSILIPSGMAYGMTGSGTVGDPYVIYNVNDLQNMSNNLGGHYILANNINASATSGWNGGAGFAPIGNFSNPFTGSLNGGNYTISGLFINRPSTNGQGLFGYVNTATISNVGLIGENITGQYFVGGVVAQATLSIISKVYSTGSVNGSYSSGLGRFGGIIGQQYSGTINNSYSMCSVNGGINDISGGLVGYESGGIISNSYSMGSVSGGSYHKGGLVGFCYGGIVSNSYYDTSTSGQSDTGKGIPKTTAEMKQQATFVGWDFTNIWYIINGITYPTFHLVISAPAVTTLSATYTSSTTAQLNGFLDSDGGGTTTVWFQYALWNGSAWVGNATTAPQSCGIGNYFNAALTGLSNSSTYTFEAQASNSLGVSNGSWVNFSTTSGVLQPPTGVYIVPGSTTMSLYWTMGLNSSCTYIVYKVGAYPASISDGNIWGIVGGTSGTLSYCFTGTSYYFALYGADGIGGNSSTAAYVMATTTAGGSTVINNPTLPPINVSGATTTPNSTALTNNPLYAFINAMDDAGVGMPHDTWWLLLTIGMLVVVGLYIVARYRNLMAAMIAVIVIGVIASNLGIFPIWVLYLFGFSGLGLSWKELR